MCNDQEDGGGPARGPSVHELAAEAVKGILDARDDAKGVGGEEAEVQGCEES